MNETTLLVTAVIPALAGLVVGFAAGLMAGAAATLRWIARRIPPGGTVPTYRDDTNPTPGHRPWRGLKHLPKLGGLLAILGLLGFLAGVTSMVQNNQTAQCLAEFVAHDAVATRGRAEAAELDRLAIRQQRQVTLEFNQILIESVVNPKTDKDAQAKAREDFLVKARDWDARLAEVDRLDQQAEQQRRDNPLPVHPDC